MDNAFYGPRSRENARLLLKAAEDLGYEPQVVRTAPGGYQAPADVVETALGIADVKEDTEYPPPAEAEEAKAELVRPNNGASREDWKNYAEARGVEVTEDDKRDGIIEKVDAKEGSN